MAQLKYGNEIVEKLKLELEKTDAQIEELENELTSINKEITDLEDEFSLESVNKQKDLLGQKMVYERALEKAEKHRSSMIEERTDETIGKCLEVLEQVENEAQKKVNEKNEQIENKVKEIHALYDEIKSIDTETRKEMNDLTAAIKPYVSEKPSKSLIRWGAAQPKILLLEEKTRGYKDRNNMLFTVIGFNENKYGISGLVPPKKR